MPFQPIQTSGVPFTFDRDGAGTPTDATMLNSIVTAGSDQSDEWAIKFDAEQTLRISVVTFARSSAGDAFFEWNGGANFQDNLSPTPTVSWEPSPFEATISPGEFIKWQLVNEGGYTEQSQFLVEIDAPEPPATTPDCDEPGQVTRCYVSTYDAPRIHESRLFQQGKRCLEANFNGAIGVGRTIVFVKWSMQTPYSVVMDTARITTDQRSVRVNITAAWTGDAWMRAQVTLDNGEIYTQLFHVVVPPSPWFGDVSPTAGPSELTASAP